MHSQPHLALLPLLLLIAFPSPAAPAALEGDLDAHDPSRIVRCKDLHWLFATGRGCRSKSSADLISWEDGPRVFDPLPAWVAGAAPGNGGDVWAPDIVQLNGGYSLYYSVSSWGSQLSAIGLATSPTLDPGDPAYRWADRGIVIQSRDSDDFNCIDPCPILEGDGTLWLSFGSYWSGIKLVQLNPGTGLRISPSSPIHSLAGGSIEASYVHRRGSWYYLFFNRGSCCQGVTSTYRIRVGRSREIAGPYLDRSGVDLLDGGGTPFLESTGRYVGPGHVGILAEGGLERFGYHYYDGLRDGAATLDFEALAWDAGGWPYFTNRWMAFYTFESGFLDEVSKLDGEPAGGAIVADDPQRGRVLQLGGGARVALHPGAAKALTFSAWVKWSGGPAWQRILDFGADTSSYLYLTPKAASGRVRFAVTTGGPGQERILEGGSALPAGTWAHVAVTLGGGRGALYVNGRSVAVNEDMPDAPWRLGATNVWLGRSQFEGDPPFEGRVDSLRIFGRSLTATEVAALASGEERDLLARYAMEEVSGTVARDGSPNGNDAEVRGDPVRDGDAYVLDGAADYLQTPVASGSERTLAAWIRLAGSRDVVYIESVFDSDVPGKHGTGWGFDNRKIKVILDDRFWETGAAVQLGRWTHVALAFDRTSARLHVDGEPAASIAYSQGELERAAYRIGRSNANALYFQGAIRDARIYGRALAAEEIRTVFKEGGGEPLFTRGDPNADGAVDISDAVAILGALFLGTSPIACEAAADANGDSAVDISDPVAILGFLFLGSRSPPDPFPHCGPDPETQGLPCGSFPHCQ